MGWGIVAFAAFLLLLAGLVVYAVLRRTILGEEALPTEPRSAEARARYARGEMDHDELEERRRHAGG
jgi:hypothetical protein